MISKKVFHWSYFCSLVNQFTFYLWLNIQPVIFLVSNTFLCQSFFLLLSIKTVSDILFILFVSQMALVFMIIYNVFGHSAPCLLSDQYIYFLGPNSHFWVDFDLNNFFNLCFHIFAIQTALRSLSYHLLSELMFSLFINTSTVSYCLCYCLFL